MNETTPKGYCKWCWRPLVPIGTARKNGRAHEDWGNRKYHKKCWQQVPHHWPHPPVSITPKTAIHEA